MTDLVELQKQLQTIADTVNAFKSEAVQLRVVEVLLAQLGVRPESPSALAPPAKKARRRKITMNAAAGAGGGAASPTKTPARKAARPSGSPGAFAMITQLLADGFFKSPRTIGDIVSHCGTTKGHHYKANECSPSLLRLLRDKKLTRKKNNDGQYEYTQA